MNAGASAFFIKGVESGEFLAGVKGCGRFHQLAPSDAPVNLSSKALRLKSYRRKWHRRSNDGCGSKKGR